MTVDTQKKITEVLFTYLFLTIVLEVLFSNSLVFVENPLSIRVDETVETGPHLVSFIVELTQRHHLYLADLGVERHVEDPGARPTNTLDEELDVLVLVDRLLGGALQ